MPSAKLFLDFDTRKFKDINGTNISSLSGKIKSIREYELSVIQNDFQLSLPTGTAMTVALKIPTTPVGSLLTSAVAAQTGWGTGSRWFFRLNLSGPAFVPTVIGTKVDFDVMILIPDDPIDQVFMSVTVPFTLERPVQVPPP